MCDASCAYPVQVANAELRSLPKPNGNPELEHRQKHTANQSDFPGYSPEEAHTVPCQKGFGLYPRLYETPISARVSSHNAFQRLRKGTNLQELTADAPRAPMLPFPTRSPGLLPWTCLPLASIERKAVRGVVGEKASTSSFLLTSYFPL